MATTGTRNTQIAFGTFQISVCMRKAHQPRDLKTEYVNEAGEKVTMGGGAGGSRKPAAGVEKAVRVTPDHVVRLPADELARIEDSSKARWEQMRVLECVDYRQVPTERILGSYWLQPAQGSAQGLYLLHRALNEQHCVAVVKWCSSSREKLGVIRPRWRGTDRALLLSELSFANDFADPDEDALAINEAEAMLEDRDPASHDRMVSAARELVAAFKRAPGHEKHIETASDEAVDARLALLERLQGEAFAAGCEQAGRVAELQAAIDRAPALDPGTVDVDAPVAA